MNNEQMVIDILKKLVCDLVNDNYQMIIDDGRNGELTEEEIKRAISEYGGKLTNPPDDAYYSRALNIIEIKENEKYHIEFDLWIDNERSDLSLICNVIFENGKVKHIIIKDIHVL